MGEDENVTFRYLKFDMSVRHPSEHVKLGAEYMGPQLGREFAHLQDRHSGVTVTGIHQN